MSYEWQDYALCAEVDPELFFPEVGSSSAPAKRICAKCEVRDACGEYALDSRIKFGVWGGMSELDRRQARRDRARSAA